MKVTLNRYITSDEIASLADWLQNHGIHEVFDHDETLCPSLQLYRTAQFVEQHNINPFLFRIAIDFDDEELALLCKLKFG